MKNRGLLSVTLLGMIQCLMAHAGTATRPVKTNRYYRDRKEEGRTDKSAGSLMDQLRKVARKPKLTGSIKELRTSTESRPVKADKALIDYTMEVLRLLDRSEIGRETIQELKQWAWSKRSPNQFLAWLIYPLETLGFLDGRKIGQAVRTHTKRISE